MSDESKMTLLLFEEKTKNWTAAEEPVLAA